VLHETTTQDAERRSALAQAIEDAAADVGEWRHHRSRLSRLRQGNWARAAELELGAELRDRIGLVAKRVDLTADQLIELVIVGHRSPGHKSGAGSTPMGLRELQTKVAAAIATEQAARKQWDEARHAFGRARTARREAEEAYKAYAAQPLVID